MSTLFGPEHSRSLTVSLVEHGRVLVVHVAGDLDLRTAPVLREHLRPVWGRTDLSAVVLDAAELAFCDSTDLSELIVAFKRCDTAEMRFMLSGVHGMLARVLTITGLRRTFRIHDTAADAVRAAS